MPSALFLHFVPVHPVSVVVAAHPEPSPVVSAQFVPGVPHPDGVLHLVYPIACTADAVSENTVTTRATIANDCRTGRSPFSNFSTMGGFLFQGAMESITDDEPAIGFDGREFALTES